MPAYNEWDEDLAAALAEPFPANLHKTKRQGGTEITFVEWHRYADRLNATVGPNGWEVHLRFHDVGGKLVTVAALTILGVTKENVGDEDEDKDNYGTACTNSFAQAYKRAAALFGLGLYMYDKAGREAASKGGGSGQRPKASKGGGGQATDKQKSFLEKLATSSVFTDTERAAMRAALASGDFDRVSSAISWAKEQTETRKEAA